MHHRLWRWLVDERLAGERPLSGSRARCRLPQRADSSAQSPVGRRLWASLHRSTAFPSLPYRDGLVNLVVVRTPSTVPLAEVTRVLVPGGVAMLRRDQRWEKIVKPAGRRHRRLDPLSVRRDRQPGVQGHSGCTALRHPVGRPDRAWSRSHERMSSLTAMVSANGRVFSIIDEGPAASIYLPPKWRLVARDAFNGVKLWERDIPEWHSHLFSLKRGPFQLPRRLVAVGDRVFVTLGLHAPLVMLDAATGETLRTYENTENTDVVLYCNDQLGPVGGPVAGEGAAGRLCQSRVSGSPGNSR